MAAFFIHNSPAIRQLAEKSEHRNVSRDSLDKTYEALDTMKHSAILAQATCLINEMLAENQESNNG